MRPNHFEKIIGTTLYSGLIPFAPGTCGSFAALLIYLIPGFENPTIMLLCISVFTLAGFSLGGVFEKTYGKDPSIFTLDEAVGMWITLLMLPKSPLVIVIAFAVWRGMDIFKPFPANKAESLKGGYGIMLDDIIAGIYSLILVHIIVYFIY